MDALSIAMIKNDLPMVKFMVRDGALQNSVQSFDCEYFGGRWSRHFHDSNLGVEAFIYDTAFGSRVLQPCREEAVRTAIEKLSVLPLRWLRDTGRQFDIASAKQIAESRHKSQLEAPPVKRLISWLDKQASLAVMCSKSSQHTHISHSPHHCAALHFFQLKERGSERRDRERGRSLTSESALDCSSW